MEARAVEIEAERKLAETRLEQAEQSNSRRRSPLLKANPADPFLKEQVQLTERRHRGAELEDELCWPGRVKPSRA